MANDIELPDYLKAMIESGHTGASADNLVGAVSSVPRISLKGQKFRLIVEGEEKEVIREKMHVVILGTQPDMPRLMAKTYYEGKYNPNDSGPPDCSSSDGITPDTWITSPQAERCANCVHNKWGSATSEISGKKSKACRDSKRLFVVKPTEISEGTIYTVNVTVSSLKALSEYGRYLSENQIPMSAAITTLVLDDESDFPKLEFELAGIMKQESGVAAIKRSEAKEWAEYDGKQITHDGSEGSDKPALTAPDESTSSGATINEDGSIEGTTEPETKADKPSKAGDIDDILENWD